MRLFLIILWADFPEEVALHKFCDYIVIFNTHSELGGKTLKKSPLLQPGRRRLIHVVIPIAVVDT